jgi:hypothetical protein
VRLEPGNAARLYALVEKEGLPNTKVVVTGDVYHAFARRHGYSPLYPPRSYRFGY